MYPSSYIKTSAPANVMLMGEHAVLFGHDAIVCALSQRMHICLTPRNDKKVIIKSDLENFESTIETVADAQHPTKLSFVLAAICLIQPKQGFELSIESEFSHVVGLGSSAAVTAASVYALLLFTHNKQVTPEKVFEIGLKVIHHVQKRGSGSDLAASVFGGLVAYQAYPEEKRRIEPLLCHEQMATTTLPNSLFPRLHLQYCGYKTPTTEVLRIVSAKVEQFPHIYAGLYQQMQQVTLIAKQAILNNDWLALGELMNIYHGLMDALGVSDAALSQIVYTQRKQENILGAKISGSGLGDCVISLSAPHTPNPVIRKNASHITEEMLESNAFISAELEPQGIQHHDS